MEELIRILRAQLVLCQELLKLEPKHREYLLAKKRAETASVIAKEEEYIGKITVLERQKLRVFNQKNCADLASFIQEEQASAQIELVKTLAERLQKSVLALKDQKQQNTEILQKYVEFIDFSVNVMTQTTNDNIYARQGDTSPTSVLSNKKMFDQKI
jgi:flagellar biosynthesis/type III secretory pathway chaperone